MFSVTSIISLARGGKELTIPFPSKSIRAEGILGLKYYSTKVKAFKFIKDNMFLNVQLFHWERRDCVVRQLHFCSSNRHKNHLVLPMPLCTSSHNHKNTCSRNKHVLSPCLFFTNSCSLQLNTKHNSQYFR